MPAATYETIGEVDYLIVGAGSAGCVLANRLSADLDSEVLLLEAGGKDNYAWIHIPVGYLYTMNNPRTDWCFMTEAEEGLNGRRLNYPRGRVLGGCSSINGMIYMRGQAADYDHWRQLGNTGWGWEDVLPYFIRSEDNVRGADAFHGAGGEWRVEEMRLSWEILEAFRDAAAEAGYPRTDDFNRGDNEGFGFFQVNQKRGVRWNTSKAFLKPVKDRPNLTVETGAQAESLIIEDGRAVGVRFRQGLAQKAVRVRREVILAAGAIGSPHLLQLSGIGPGSLLQKSGIEVLHDLPGVGGNLQDHLQIRMAFRVSGTRTLNERSSRFLSRLGMGLEYFLLKRGPLTMAPSQLGGFVRSDPSQATPNMEYHVQPLSTERLGDPLHPFPAFTASVCNLRPVSRGYVAVKGPDPTEAPAIKPCYLAEEADRQVAAQAIRVTRRIVAQPALQRFRPVEFKPGPEIDGDAELASAAGDIASTIFHPVGTCRMGDDSQAVVDSRLRVRGIAGLRVVDASIMPTITSGNTNAPTIMIAEKAADLIGKDAKAALTI